MSAGGHGPAAPDSNALIWAVVCDDGRERWLVYVLGASAESVARAVAILALRGQAADGESVDVMNLRALSAELVTVPGRT